MHLAIGGVTPDGIRKTVRGRTGARALGPCRVAFPPKALTASHGMRVSWLRGHPLSPAFPAGPELVEGPVTVMGRRRPLQLRGQREFVHFPASRACETESRARGQESQARPR
jgi:hypothetical protein